ncbi:MAG: hypothetical protein ACFB21_13935 [Opitutales bacterium]
MAVSLFQGGYLVVRLAQGGLEPKVFVSIFASVLLPVPLALFIACLLLGRPRGGAPQPASPLAAIGVFALAALAALAGTGVYELLTGSPFRDSLLWPFLFNSAFTIAFAGLYTTTREPIGLGAICGLQLGMTCNIVLL